MELYLPAVAAALYEAYQYALGLGRGAEVHLRGEDAEDGPRPGVAALRVAYHLALVYDGDVPAAVHRQLLRRGGEMRVAPADVLLLARAQRTVDAAVQQRLLRLEREQAQRGEVHAAFGAYEPPEAGVGLAGVRPAQVQNEAAAHGARVGILVLGIERNEQREACAYGLRHIPDRPDRAQPLGGKLRVREARRGQEGVQIRLRLPRGELLERAGRRGAKRADIALPHPGADGAVLHSDGGPGPCEALEGVGELLFPAALFKRQELAYPALGPADGGEGPALRRAQPREDAPVAVQGQEAGVSLVRLGRGPDGLQGGAGAGGRPRGGGARRLLRRGPALRPEALALLGPEDLRPLPEPHALRILRRVYDAGLGQQRADKRVGPAALFERGVGIFGFGFRLRHAQASLPRRARVSIAQNRKIFNGQ